MTHSLFPIIPQSQNRSSILVQSKTIGIANFQYNRYVISPIELFSSPLKIKSFRRFIGLVMLNYRYPGHNIRLFSLN